MGTVRLTVAQALVRFLANQYSERDGVQQRLIPGASASSGTATWPASARRCCEAATTGDGRLPYYLARNEQGMVHAAVGYARCATGCRRWPAPRRSAPARRTC